MVTSTINPLIPVANTLVEQSGPALRQNFLAAYNDINALLAGGGVGGSLTIGAPVAGGVVGDVLTVGSGTLLSQTPATSLLVGNPIFGNVSEAQEAVIPDTINNLQVAGFASSNDGGGGNYTRGALTQLWSGDGSQPQPLVPPVITSGGLPILVYTTTIQGPTITLHPIFTGDFSFIVAFSRRPDFSTYPSTVVDSAGNTYILAGSVSVSSGSYNSGTGVVTLHLAAPLPPTVNVGDGIYVALTGTGSVASLNGAHQTVSISGTTVTYQAATSLTLTITGGSAVAIGGATVFQPVAFLYYCANPIFAPIGTTFTGLGSYDIAYDVYTVPGFTGAVPDQFAVQFVPSGGTGGVNLTSPALTGSGELVVGIVNRGGSPRDATGVLSYTPPAGWFNIAPTLTDGNNPVSCIATTSTSPVTYNPTWVGSNPSTTTIVCTFKTFPRALINPSYWQLIPSFPVHTAAYGISTSSPDLDNAIPFINFSRWLASIAAPSGASYGSALTGQAGATVTISIGSPAIVTVVMPGFNVNPGFRNGSMVSFPTTGILPAPLDPNKIYYIQYGTVTYNPGTQTFTFQISETSIFLRADGTQTSVKGTPIATSGSQSGVHSYKTYGESWTDVVLDPGIYYSSNNRGPVLGCGLKKWRLFGAGARFQTPVFFSNTPWGDINANTSGTGAAFSAQFQTTTAQGSSIANSITLVTPALASNFYVNSWVVLMADELQSSQSGNWNPAYFEYQKVQSVNASTGVIKFWDCLQFNYRSTYPTFAARAGDWSGAICGPATIVQLNDAVDQEIEIHDTNLYTSTEEEWAGVISLKVVNCEIFGWDFKTGPFPTTMRKFVMERCNCHNFIPEIDKMIDELSFIESTFDQNSHLLFQASNINKMVIERCRMQNGFFGTPRNLVIRDSYIAGEFQIGPVYGSTDNVIFENSHINWITNANQEQEILPLSSVTFSGGTLIIPVGTTTIYGTWRGPSAASECPVIWAAPGAKIAITAQNITTFGNALGFGVHCNFVMGGIITAFTVADVKTNGGGDYCVDTTLRTLPSTTITVTGTMAGAVLTVTAISPADACLLNNMDIVATAGGTLPAGTVISSDLGVPNNTSNLGAYTLSHAPASGAPTSFTASVKLYFLPHTCPRFTATNCTGGRLVTEMSRAPPGVPIYSYFLRAFSGFAISTFFPQAYIALAGNLTSWTIDVQDPYTGSAGTYTATIYMFGWKNAAGNYYPTFLKQVINLKTAGVRTITSTGTPGGVVAGDTLVAVPFWLTGEHLVVIGPTIGGGDTLANMPNFVMQGQTKQGIEFASMVVNTTTAGLDELSDTVTGMAIQ